MKLVRKKLLALFIISLCIVGVNHVYEDVSAEFYEGSVGISFTLNPTINVTVSGDLVISNLTPGDYKDSNNITVTTLSNSIAGYSLYANTGSSSNNSNELRKDGTSTTNKFTSITTDVASLSDFTDNTWGYSYCNVSTNCATSTNWTNYSYLPKYSDSNDKLLIANNTNTTTSLEFKIGARASTNQIAGEYTNIINFIGIANPNPQPIYMQDITLAGCQKNVGTSGNPANIGDNVTVVDRRDGNIYTVRYINGECWMTQNLRITGTITATDSNFTGDSFNVSQYSLDANDASYANHCDSTNSFNYACAKDSNSDTTGVWYNYYATTAGTIATSSNTNPATEDICPSGWHLPSGPNTTVDTDINKLIGNTTSGSQDATDGLIAFEAVTGGYYNNDGMVHSTGYGYYWQSTAATDVRYRHILRYNSSNSQFIGDNSGGRQIGIFVRCIKSS